ncbi:MAG: 3-mercaptopropionate dioxygenase [Streptosporangiaceae bacterium]|jgi:predicted metal-dependent enzyme (double-stranded beta helix superfamily)|nr:3-mercaptopropionate dioxygenase [Streptosporangiaceae bacterium]
MPLATALAPAPAPGTAGGLATAPAAGQAARCPAGLLTALRRAVRQRGDWDQTSRRVARALGRHLPGPEILTAAERLGDPVEYQSHLMHAEPDGSFSVVALVWRPGQITPIHDHVTWCVIGVLQGAEYEELFALCEGGTVLEEVGTNAGAPGDVSGFAPPGDIHQVRNRGTGVAISLHVYGADISRLGSSVRRIYDLPVRTAPARRQDVSR